MIQLVQYVKHLKTGEILPYRQRRLWNCRSM